MLRFHELEQNPVTVTCADESGAAYDVIAMRLRGGIVQMTCQCPHYLVEGWCKHCLAVFTDQGVFADTKHRAAFDRLVGATHLQEAAVKLINALEAFATVYRQMDSVRPNQIQCDQLTTFAVQAGRAASSADDLAEALAGFVSEAAARRSSADRPAPVGASISEDKRGALERVRRALAKSMKS
jgi:hypothetical protein